VFAVTATATPQPASSVLWLGNLAYDLTEHDVLAFARRHGLFPVRCKLPVERETGRSRGFAFLTMASPTDAADALTILGGAELGGRQLRADMAKPDPRPARPEGRQR
jgi:RNA recognition motif-containing protein